MPLSINTSLTNKTRYTAISTYPTQRRIKHYGQDPNLWRQGYCQHQTPGVIVTEEPAQYLNKEQTKAGSTRAKLANNQKANSTHKENNSHNKRQNALAFHLGDNLNKIQLDLSTNDNATNSKRFNVNTHAFKRVCHSVSAFWIGWNRNALGKLGRL